MRRIIQVAALPLLALAALAAGGAGPAAAAAAAHASAAASCAGTIQIDSFAFSQPVVTAGQFASATLTATNCTAQPLNATVTAYGRFFGPSGNTLPAGCPVVDPIALPTDFAAGGQYTNNFGTSTFASCTAASYEEIVSFSVGGTTVATATATVAIQSGAAACHVVYTTQSQWQGGFVAAISITNTTTAPVSGWTLTFTFGGDQHIGYVWGASGSQTGETVTLTSTPSNSSIAGGATLSGIGFTGTWHAGDVPPTAFSLNGVACS
ncbi:cellulose binding domain-containing protein [Actinocrinis puniceicyclus]|uniref:Cellulose binding domain-containing protein n=1 Tax=Actinocrinis puniceicyclus TaxID=977794 RepID=A0A8J7WS68_9ACTN|nr:cellulose binding domain-containing protein [Actinocrinis puniceicyclus]MBS2964354.1 cellulose binding domain-containing protein [Actinocrinis puniceicyclus]